MTAVAADAATATNRDPLGVWLVTDVYPPGCGGSGWSAHALARTLVAHGHPVEVIALDPAAEGVGQRVFEGVRVTELGVGRARRSPRRRLGSHDYAYDQLVRYLSGRLAQAPNVGVVHAQHLHSGPPAVAAAALSGKASVQTLRDYWPVCLHGTSFWNGAECSGCSTANLTGCLSEYQRWPTPLSRAMVGWAQRRLATRRGGVAAADRVITVSEWVRDRIAREIPEARFEVIPNIVDAQEAAAAAAAAADVELPWEGAFLLAAGKLQATKGFDRMLDDLAAAESSTPVVIAGTGPEEQALRTQADDLGIPAFFPGWVEHTQLLRLMQRAHAFLLPGAWNEPMSRLLLESLALGAPVVAWPSGGNTEVLTSGEDGFVVEDSAALAAALAALADPERRSRIGAAAAALATRQFSPAAVYPRMRAAYGAAIAHRSSRSATA